jgi:aryl-alcohol dehydrogenase-like predicted oxidoreductase
MNYRKLGKTGFEISEVGLGTWQIGGGWGKPFNPKTAEELLHGAFDKGVNFVDTADVYDAGLSEAAVGKAVRERSEKIFIATKCGRRIQPHVNDAYTAEKLRKHVEDSLRNTGIDRLDLIQLHCPPEPVYKRDEIFQLFEELKKEGKIAAMGVSVEKVTEGLSAIKYEIVSSIQVIFNVFRQKPFELLFRNASKNNIGIIARVPLASGLLGGKINAETTYSKDDHRYFNKEGKAFDKGETFSGVPLEKAFLAIEELKSELGLSISLSEFALKWILMFPAVSTVIPGASKLSQLESNVQVSDLSPLTEEQMTIAKNVYEKYIKEEVHHLW